MDAQKLDSQSILDVVIKKIPVYLLAKFSTEEDQLTYAQILSRLVREVLTPGTTIAEALIVERIAYYYTRMKIEEKPVEGKTFTISSDYKYYAKEYNENSRIIRYIVTKGLPEAQRANIAERLVEVIKKVIVDPDQRDAIIDKFIDEYSIDIVTH